MGGTKKPTITKLKKWMSGRKKETGKEERRKEVYKIVISSQMDKELRQYIKRLKYVTPFLISKRAEIKLSIARSYLRKLAEEGFVELVEKNRELEIYVPKAA